MYAGVLIVLAGQRLGMRGRAFFGLELMTTEVDGSGASVLLRRVMIYTVIVEFITFILLLPWFMIEQPGGISNGRAVWLAGYHAISAFNNAGFDLMGGSRSFVGQAHDAWPMVVMGISAFLGSLSFLTVFNLRQPRRRWTLDTKLVITGMAALLVVGMAFFLIADWSRLFADQSVGSKLVNSLFLSVNRTTGMTTAPLDQASDDTSLAMIILMFIGGASTSTASGIKIGSFMVVMFGIVSALDRIGARRRLRPRDSRLGRAPSERARPDRAGRLRLRAALLHRGRSAHRGIAGGVRRDVGAGQLRLDAGRVAGGDANRGQYPDHDDVRRPVGTAGDRQRDSRSAARAFPLSDGSGANRLGAKMQVAVLGLGRFGAHLAEALDDLGHEVLAIDLDESNVHELAPKVTDARIADITDIDALRALSVGEVDVCGGVDGGSGGVGAGDDEPAATRRAGDLREGEIGSAPANVETAGRATSDPPRTRWRRTLRPHHPRRLGQRFPAAHAELRHRRLSDSSDLGQSNGRVGIGTRRRTGD